MPKRSKLRVWPTVGIGVLTVVTCLAIGFIYIGGDPGIIGYVAMGLGLLAAILLGVGVALLIHHGEHSD